MGLKRFVSVTLLWEFRFVGMKRLVIPKIMWFLATLGLSKAL